MTARILVVDDIPINIKLLEAKLLAEYFEVLTADSGQQAIEVAQQEYPDLILLDVMMPGMDGFEVCQHLRANAKTAHIPIVMVTALDGVEDRVKGLNSGADDFLTKPIDETALMARINNLVRLKLMRDELRLRQDAGADLGEIVQELGDVADVHHDIFLLENRATAAKRIASTLQERFNSTVHIFATPQAAFEKIGEMSPDIIITTLMSAEFDGLRFCSQVRSMDFMRHVPILVVADTATQPNLLKALQMGVNDYLLRPIEKNELVARVASQCRWKRYADKLRDTYRQSIELATTDPLTGLYNRRYMDTYLKRQMERARETRKTFSVLLVDVDHFKSVNDVHGHGAGDEVLKGVAGRMKAACRGMDLVCRFGGEEFVVFCPESELEDTRILGERLRKSIASRPFDAGSGKELTVTASLGAATFDPAQDDNSSLLERADKALYAAKEGGRNRVHTLAA